jgi:hypothetical protein
MILVSSLHGWIRVTIDEPLSVLMKSQCSKLHKTLYRPSQYASSFDFSIQ